MSKQHNSLKQAQEMRNNKYTLALQKKSLEASTDHQKQFVYAQPAEAPRQKSWGLMVFITLCIFTVMVVIIGTFFTLKTYAAKESQVKPVKKSSQVIKKPVRSTKKPSQPKQSKTKYKKNTYEAKH